MKSSLVRAAVVAGIVAVALTFTASPAMAVPSPRALTTDSQFFLIDCQKADLYSLNAQTAALTIVGSNSNSAGDCARQPAWDAQTDTAYFILETGSGKKLTTIDPDTGAQVAGAVLHDGGATPTVNAMAIDPISGDAYAYASGGLLYGLNLSNSSLSLIGTSTGSPDVQAMAFQPTTGDLYIVTRSGAVSTVDTTTGALTSVGSITIPSSQILSLQIDSNGIFWLDVFKSSPTSTHLWSFNPVDFANSGSDVGSFTRGGTPYNSYSLLLVPGTASTTASPAAATITSSSFGATGMRARYTGFLPGESISMYFGSSQSGGGSVASTVADANGDVDFTYLLSNAAIDDYTLTAVGDDSGLFAQAQFSVVAAAAIASTVVSALPDTGANAAPILTVGGILVLAGAAFGALSLIRRRRTHV